MGVIGKGFRALFKKTSKTDKAVLVGAAAVWAGAGVAGLLNKPNKKPSKQPSKQLSTPAVTATPIVTRPVNKSFPGKSVQTAPPKARLSPWDSMVKYKIEEARALGRPDYSNKLNKAAFDDAFNINVTKGSVDEMYKDGTRISGPHNFTTKEIKDLRRLILAIPKHEGVGSLLPSKVGGPKSSFTNIKEAYEHPYAALWAVLEESGDKMAFNMGDYMSSASDTAIRGGPTPAAVSRTPKFRKAAGVATATIAKNYRRYIEKVGGYKHSTGKRGDMLQFIKELGPIYAPPRAKEDTLGVNKSWGPGVTSFYLGKKKKKKR